MTENKTLRCNEGRSMIETMRRLINRLRGVKPSMMKKQNPDEPLYGDYKQKCERCGGPMICVNDRTHRMACADSMCRR